MDITEIRLEVELRMREQRAYQLVRDLVNTLTLTHKCYDSDLGKEILNLNGRIAEEKLDESLTLLWKSFRNIDEGVRFGQKLMIDIGLLIADLLCDYEVPSSKYKEFHYKGLSLRWFFYKIDEYEIEVVEAMITAKSS